MISTPLPHKHIEKPEFIEDDVWERQMRVMFFDPVEVYKNSIGLIDPHSRTQSDLSLSILFPKRSDGICRCGCGKKAKKFWATKHCSDFAVRIYYIISYGTANARWYVTRYHGEDCVRCGNGGCQIDHIVPVKHGGGGCWLSNYLPLCTACHKIKTKQDFKWGEYSDKPL